VRQDLLRSCAAAIQIGSAKAVLLKLQDRAHGHHERHGIVIARHVVALGTSHGTYEALARWGKVSGRTGPGSPGRTGAGFLSAQAQVSVSPGCTGPRLL